jgi:hypothetical protein
MGLWPMSNVTSRRKGAQISPAIRATRSNFNLMLAEIIGMMRHPSVMYDMGETPMPRNGVDVSPSQR